MKNKNLQHILIGISILFYFIQVFIDSLNSLPQTDFKILVLSLTPEFAYQSVIELPIWISSLFIHNSFLSPVVFLKILKAIVLFADLFLIAFFIYRSTKNLVLAFSTVLCLQFILFFNHSTLQLLLLFLFLIPSVYLFYEVIFNEKVGLNEKKKLILSSVVFGFTFLIHPVSFLLVIFLFGSLIFSKQFAKIPETYLTFLILFIFLSPKILWEIQFQSKVQCSRFIYTDTIHESIPSGFVIVDDRFKNWDQLYSSSLGKEIKFSLLSSFENRNIFLWKHRKDIELPLYFTFSNPNQNFGYTPISSGFAVEPRIYNSDEELFFSINQNFQKPFLYWISGFFFWFGQWGVFVLVPLILFFTKQNMKSFGTELVKYIILIFIAALIVTLLKNGIMRPRPLSEFGNQVWVWFKPVTQRSFPSGDAQAVFTMLIPLLWIRPKLKWLILLAPIAAFNRVIVGAHFPFDILVGSLIGISTAWIAKLWLWEKSE